MLALGNVMECVWGVEGFWWKIKQSVKSVAIGANFSERAQR